ncbi:MAG TPA: OB-fold nucleic acid binding domain-containing protein [Candidatus Sumerlaeota bacterium]|nr:OB-fold nucleic acid binding domain-containing protein [Candidatus Sumerlaeota bacterium]HON49683.1 OB-fold nucleic acid binding domain-containing protein [Candidatus Sumerlaeota bacterium]HOR64070.1 OB-fold nucleic acid binding domain-containing protein [Candidatus Sumerlaeota bacterium]HPL75347.1 OB-fold nucleic acid binding domain-containing protein [Candidatus Sumerlaeota bacterium]HRU54664.1 OB-fold nucleic acid binding domain-containing protein [Candidatus Sumerlaeia bacterium]
MKIRVFASFIIFMILLASFVHAQGSSAITPINMVTQKNIGQTVTVGGKIVSIQSPRTDTTPYSVYLTDDTETIRIVFWKETYNQIAIKEQLKPGTKIRVTGQVKDFKGNINLNVYNAADVQLFDAPISAPSVQQPMTAPPLASGVLTPSQVNSSLLERTITVQGLVKEYKAPQTERAPHTIILTDNTGSIDVVFWSDVAAGLGSEKMPAIGQTLKISGQVNEFRNKMQIKVSKASDIIPINENAIQSAPSPTTAASSAAPSIAQPEARPVEEEPSDLSDTLAPSRITDSLLGKIVKVRGKIVDIKPSWKDTAPTTVLISDGIKDVAYVYWPDLGAQLTEAQKPVIGNAVQVEGEVTEFRGKMQIKVTAPDKIVMKPKQLSATAAPLSQKQVIDIGKINKEYLNVTVAISGNITRIISVKNGRLLKVTDSTGTITVPLWDAMAQSVKQNDQIRVGAKIMLQGVVMIYEQRNEIELKLINAEDIISIE